MKLFTNPYRTIRDLNSELCEAMNSAGHWNQMYWEMYDSNDTHAKLNGKLRADIDNLEAQNFKLTRVVDFLSCIRENQAAVIRDVRDENNMLHSDIEGLIDQAAQDERAIFAHMEEREYLLDTIEDLDGEANDLVDDLIYLSKETSGLLDTIASKDADIKQANALLIDGSKAYDAVVAAGESAIEEAQNNLSNLRINYDMGKEDYDMLKADYNDVLASFNALKTSNTQSLSWVRQASEALQEYGITIDDTPVGPAVQIDRDAFVNRVALDNVTTAGVN